LLDCNNRNPGSETDIALFWNRDGVPVSISAKGGYSSAALGCDQEFNSPPKSGFKTLPKSGLLFRHLI
jgi:hypothetical protein